jgi:hypothetical protein
VNREPIISRHDLHVNEPRRHARLHRIIVSFDVVPAPRHCAQPLIVNRSILMNSHLATPGLVTRAVATSALLAIASSLCGAQALDSTTIVLQRYVTASGGSGRVAAIHSRITRDVLSFGRGIGGTRETIQEAPDLVVEHGTAHGWLGWHGVFSRGHDGAIAWSEGPEEHYHTLDANAALRYVLESRLDRLARLDSLYPQRRWVGERTLNGQEVCVVEMESTAGTHETWFLSVETGLLMQTIVSDEGAKHRTGTVTTTYDDYRDVDGLRLPFRKVIDDGSSRMTAMTQSITQNVDVPRSTFARRAP